MKADPNTLCNKYEQRIGWAIFHDAVVHPLLALALYSTWATRLHDWSSHKAWIRTDNHPAATLHDVPERYCLRKNGMVSTYSTRTGARLPSGDWVRSVDYDDLLQHMAGALTHHTHEWKTKWVDGKHTGQECTCGTERDILTATLDAP